MMPSSSKLNNINLSQQLIEAAEGLEHGMIIHDHQHILYANTYLLSVLELKLEDLQGEVPRVVVAPSEQDYVETIIQKRKGKADFLDRYETKLINSHGEAIPVNISSFPIETDGHQLVVSFITNMTDMQVAESRLKLTQEKYRHIFERSPVGIFTTDQNGVVVEANEAMAKIIEVEAPCTGEILPNYVSDDVNEYVFGQLLNGKTINDYRIETTIAGKQKVVSMSANFIPETKQIHGVLFDITDATNAEKNLLHKHEFQALLTRLATHFIELKTDEIKSGIELALKTIAQFIDADRGFIYLFNPDGQTVKLSYLWSRKRKASRKTEIVFSIDNYPNIIESLSEKGYFFLDSSDMTQQLSKAEQEIFSNFNTKSLYLLTMNSGTEPVGILGFDFCTQTTNWSKDVLDLLKIACEMLTNAIIHNRVDSQVDELYESQSKLFSQIAHSLKTPFAIALSNLELLKTESSKNNREELIQETKNHIMESTQIVNQLLRVAQMDLFPVKIRLGSYQVEDVVKSVFRKGEILSRNFCSNKDKCTTCSFELIGVDSANIVGDIKALEEALLILIDNAIKHSPEPDDCPQITIEGKKVDDQYQIIITDSGRGIKTDDLERIFHLYVRGDSRSEGAGIGLAFCKKIVEAQRGKLEVISEYGKGTKAIVTLKLEKQ